MTFGDKVKELRIQKGITQEALAEMVGVQKQSISRYENSDREPNIRTAKKIADAFGVPLATLSGNNEISEDELNYALMQKLSELRAEEVEKVLLFIQGLVAGRKD